jgi:hypothetical protein
VGMKLVGFGKEGTLITGGTPKCIFCDSSASGKIASVSSSNIRVIWPYSGTSGIEISLQRVVIEVDYDRWKTRRKKAFPRHTSRNNRIHLLTESRGRSECKVTHVTEIRIFRCSVGREAVFYKQYKSSHLRTVAKKKEFLKIHDFYPYTCYNFVYLSTDLR